jgi:hypothetical protein
MRRMQKFVIAILLLSPLIATSALAERDCPGGVCKCSGVPDCKNLDMSGQCSGPVQCGDPREQCSCVSKLKTTANSITQKKPVNKSQ